MPYIVPTTYGLRLPGIALRPRPQCVDQDSPDPLQCRQSRSMLTSAHFPPSDLQIFSPPSLSCSDVSITSVLGGWTPPSFPATNAWSGALPGQRVASQVRVDFRVSVVDRERPLLTCVTRPLAAPSALFPPSSSPSTGRAALPARACSAACRTLASSWSCRVWLGCCMLSCLTWPHHGSLPELRLGDCSLRTVASWEPRGVRLCRSPDGPL